MRHLTFSACVFCSLAVVPFVSFAQEQDTQLSMRMRSAGHEVNGNHGESASILVRLNHTSHWRDNISTFVEFDHVETYLEDQFSDGVRLNGQPFIFDAEGSDLNQAFVDLNWEKTQFRLGRQRLNFDDQRFIGSISIWQNEQTFDALHINQGFASASSFSYTYAGNVNRVFGVEADKNISPNDALFQPLNGVRPESLLGDHKLKSHFLRMQFNEWDYSRFVLFGYFDDNQDRPFVANRTVGGSYHIDYKVGDVRLRARVDGAIQQRPEVDDSSRAPYALLELAARINSFEIMSRTEMLGEDDNVAFVVPLSSLHEFNGWADKFLLTPEGGLIDKSLQVTWRNSPWRLSARYHVFNEYDGNSRYGDEIDFDLIYRLKDKHDLHLRYAIFRETEEFASRIGDSSKYFVTYSYNFN